VRPAPGPAQADVPLVRVILANITLASATALTRAVEAWNKGKIDPAGPRRFQLRLLTVEAAGKPPAWLEFRQKVNAEVAAGRPPDVAFLTGGLFTLQAVSSSFFTPLDELTKRDPAFINEFVAPAVRALTFGGRVQAVPIVLGVGVLAWSPQRFHEARAMPPLPGWSWEDFLEAGKRLVAAGRGSKGQQWWGVAEGPFAALWAHLMAQTGGGLVDIKQGRLTVRSEATQEALRQWQRLGHAYHVMPTGADMPFDQMTRLVPRGQAAMHHAMIYSGENVGSGWNVQQAPALEGRSTTSLYVMDMMGIHAKSTNVPGAYEALKVLAPWVSTRALVPAWVPALEYVGNQSPNYGELALAKDRIPIVQHGIQQGQPALVLPWNELGRMVVASLIKPLYEGTKSVTQACDDATPVIANLLPGVLL